MAINLKAPELDEIKPNITVIGVGGAGGNAVNNMIEAGLEGVEFVAANTDAQALSMSSAAKRLQIGKALTEGLGAGSRPDVGAAAAEEAVEDIRGEFKNANMVFVTAGMGGGTGTGAAPVIARTARELGLLTVGVVTKPFHFEGRKRMRAAEAGIELLAKFVDTLIVIPNQNLFRVANEKTTFADAFSLADKVLHAGVACVTDLMVKDGLINLDFADVNIIMAGQGKAMMGTGEAEGENRGLNAAEAAISNPLLDDSSLKGARGLLVSITGSEDMTLYEVDEAANRVGEEVDDDAHIIVGAIFDKALKDTIRVSVVATGLDPAQQHYTPRRMPANTEATLKQRLESVGGSEDGDQAEAQAQADTAPSVVAAQKSGGVTIETRPPAMAVPPQPGDAPGGLTGAFIGSGDSAGFVPSGQGAGNRLPRRMPTAEDFPMVGQAVLNAKQPGQSAAEKPVKKKKRGLFGRFSKRRKKQNQSDMQMAGDSAGSTANHPADPAAMPPMPPVMPGPATGALNPRPVHQPNSAYPPIAPANPQVAPGGPSNKPGSSEEPIEIPKFFHKRSAS